eukprot:CAMPEP_0115073226 /NCGR_PEP_ID=MMETSP0227-20121206/14673_1 /TAXON_ID=89957 /ORGANISM="Polarella glacialis, Strain CCMP 1383" /LENGTH=63 /DNA_ID=CAMNT_0002460071 /DNA_START=2994 /DNA_END=3185 /DNA_ORIENTATION=+
MGLKLINPRTNPRSATTEEAPTAKEASAGAGHMQQQQQQQDQVLQEARCKLLVCFASASEAES